MSLFDMYLIFIITALINVEVCDFSRYLFEQRSIHVHTHTHMLATKPELVYQQVYRVHATIL